MTNMGQGARIPGSAEALEILRETYDLINRWHITPRISGIEPSRKEPRAKVSAAKKCPQGLLAPSKRSPGEKASLARIKAARPTYEDQLHARAELSRIQFELVKRLQVLAIVARSCRLPADRIHQLYGNIAGASVDVGDGAWVQLKDLEAELILTADQARAAPALSLPGASSSEATALENGFATEAPPADPRKALLESPSGLVRLFDRKTKPLVGGQAMSKLTGQQYRIIQALLEAGDAGVPLAVLKRKASGCRSILKTLCKDPAWAGAIKFPGKQGGGYKIR